MTVGAVFALLLPIIMEALKSVLPQLFLGIVNSIFHPPTPIELAKNKLDQALAEGDLVTLGQINKTVLDVSGKSSMTTEELQDMRRLING
jgi:hypothetical protein